MRMPVTLLAMLFAALPAVATAGGGCAAQSGTVTIALVELYTSEGCDSCPPADRWLSGLQARGYGPDRVVPLALHVDYWDYIGWKDPYAKREFATRQRKHAQMKRARIVYTPQVLLQGEDFRGWSGRAFDQSVARINARPPRARLALRRPAAAPGASPGATQGVLDVELRAELLNAAERGDAAVFLAAYENKLLSKVAAGENRGKSLAHDFVVREWIGPLEFGATLTLTHKRALPLLPNADPAQSGVAAFVQNRASGEVLQALMLPPCPA
ncbi:MAG: DUF1223 domain-containing protein [Betaproteobacteria bacterium]|nr:DUF1223 domain-containing protein [Betaproteobacteria bacterium]